MPSVKPHQSRNTLTISYTGRVRPNDVRRCVKEDRVALPLLEPGFRLLVDLTELQTMEVACSALIADIMEICNAAGVAEVVRIIPDPSRDIGLQIMSFFHYGNDVQIHTCASAAEARELLLNEPAKDARGDRHHGRYKFAGFISKKRRRAGMVSGRHLPP